MCQVPCSMIGSLNLHLISGPTVSCSSTFDSSDASLSAVMSLGKAARSLIRPVQGALRPSASSRSYAAVAEARAVLEGELEGIRAAGTWKAERIITSKQGPQINVDSSRSREWQNFGGSACLEPRCWSFSKPSLAKTAVL